MLIDGSEIKPEFAKHQAYTEQENKMATVGHGSSSIDTSAGRFQKILCQDSAAHWLSEE